VVGSHELGVGVGVVDAGGGVYVDECGCETYEADVAAEHQRPDAQYCGACVAGIGGYVGGN